MASSALRAPFFARISTKNSTEIDTLSRRTPFLWTTCWRAIDDKHINLLAAIFGEFLLDLPGVTFFCLLYGVNVVSCKSVEQSKWQ
jgi:hypothetical protein